MDGELLERARAGDADAFDQLARARIDAVYRTAIGILGNSADARDATQEALVSAWRSLRSLREPDHFDAWLHAITVNAAKMVARRRRVREIPMTADLEQADLDPGAVGAADFDAAFDRLTVDQRAVLVAHHLDGESVAQLAVRLGVPEGTVKSRLHTARKALDRLLAEDAR